MARYSWGFLTVGSEIELPELKPSVAEPQVWITLGRIPETTPYVIEQGYCKAVSADEFLFEVKSVVRFLVRGKTEVVVDRSPGADDVLIRLYLLSSIMSILLHKWGSLPLHASSVVVDNNAFLFCAESGSGKSTLALGLHQRGYQVLNDDVSAIDFIDGSPLVSRGCTRLKLNGDSLDKYAIDPLGYQRFPDEKQKYCLPINPKLEVDHFPVKAVFFLEVADYEQVSSEPVSGVVAFELLRQHTFRKNVLTRIGVNQSHFDCCCGLANSIPLVKVRRPRNFSHALFVDYIESIMSDIKVQV